MEKITLRNGKTIIIKETLDGWSTTNEENRYSLKFSNRSFKDIEEVKEYVMALYSVLCSILDAQ